jgi:hypothetical protein
MAGLGKGIGDYLMTPTNILFIFSGLTLYLE